MNYFRDYMMSVCAIIIITSVVSEILVDFSWSKYINLICGVLFAVCLINPLSDILSINVESFKLDYVENESDVDFISENVRKEFSDSLSKKIHNDIKTEFNKDIKVYAGLKDDKLYILISDFSDDNIVNYIQKEYKPHIIDAIGE